MFAYYLTLTCVTFQYFRDGVFLHCDISVLSMQSVAFCPVDSVILPIVL